MRPPEFLQANSEFSATIPKEFALGLCDSWCSRSSVLIRTFCCSYQENWSSSSVLERFYKMIILVDGYYRKIRPRERLYTF